MNVKQAANAEEERLDFQESVGVPMCGKCVHFKVRADINGIESTCKRLDHKHIQFALPCFKSYDCGQFRRGVCRDFAPESWCKVMHKNWTTFDDYYGEIPESDTVALVIDGDRSVRYHVSRRDFVDNTFLDADGNLKWLYKRYYKQTRESFGYKLVTEYNKAVKSDD